MCCVAIWDALCDLVNHPDKQTNLGLYFIAKLNFWLNFIALYEVVELDCVHKDAIYLTNSG